MNLLIKPVSGTCNIAFQGGEPTLAGLEFYRKVIWNVWYYNHKRLPVTYALQTNGYALDEEWCRFFKEHGFLIGLSIDGTEEIHNTYRKGKDGSQEYSLLPQEYGQFLIELFQCWFQDLKQTELYIPVTFICWMNTSWEISMKTRCLPLTEGVWRLFF